MKKSILLLNIIMLVLFTACEKDETRAVISENIISPVITFPENNFSKVIGEDDLDQTITFRWIGADYGVPTEVRYLLELDSEGNDFKNADTLGISTSDSIVMTYASLNTIIIDSLGLPTDIPLSLEIRLRAAINGMKEVQSEVTTMNITAWEAPEPELPTVPVLLVPGDYQDWDVAAAPALSELEANIFEGYIYMNVAGEFNFTNAPNFDNDVYGYGGSAGKLSLDAAAPKLSVSEAGYYKINANTTSLTYSSLLVNTWGIIGTATPGQWDASTAMEYFEEENVWTLTTDLVAGALKFRANDAWDLNYGPADSNVLEGELITTDGAISIPEDGNYTITLDFSKESNPSAYTYKVVLN